MSTFSSTKNQLSATTDEVNQRINLIVSVLQPFVITNIGQTKISLIEPKHLEQFEQLKNILIMQRQHSHYLMSLLKSLSKTKSEIDHSLKKFKETVRAIHEIVQFRTAIPTDKIFVSIR